MEPEGDGEDLLQRKCRLLKRKCDEFEEMNSVLFAKTKKIHEMIESAEAEKRFLVMKLEQFEDVQFPQPSTLTPLTTHTSSLYTARHKVSSSFITLDPASPSATPPNQATPTSTAHPSLAPMTATSLTSAKVTSLLSSLVSTKTNPAIASAPVSSAKTKKVPKVSTIEKQRKDTAGVGVMKKKKGDSDPNAPKKPSNAFFWFCQELRPSLQEHFKGEGVAGQHDLTKVLAKLWSEATAEDKKVYYERYAEDKQRYNRQLQEYTAKQQPPPENPGTS